MVNHELSFKRDYAYSTAKLLGVARRGAKDQETRYNNQSDSFFKKKWGFSYD
jgi:hypothetical protein